MQMRRFGHISDDDDDDDDDDDAPRIREDSGTPRIRKDSGTPRIREDSGAPCIRENSDADGDRRSKLKKKLRVDEAEEDGGRSQNSKKGGRRRKSRGSDEEWYEEDEEHQLAKVKERAKPIGNVVRVSGNGKEKKVHFASFEYNRNVFEVEDPVTVAPEDIGRKPGVAIIKDITQDTNGSLWVTGQWFYRPEEAAKKGGGRWKARDSRVLFYSFHLDDVPAETVMHKCNVHFIPSNKKLPLCQAHRDFIVQNVYDTVERKLWKLTDKDYEDPKQHEIYLLVQKTRENLGEFVDIEFEAAPTDQFDESANRQTVNPIGGPRSDDAIKSDHQKKAEAQGGCANIDSECKAILAKFKALTSNPRRDKWLAKLLKGIWSSCVPNNSVLSEDKKIDDIGNSVENMNSNRESTITKGPKENKSDAGESISWPGTAVWVVTSLERAAHKKFGSDSKYNQKMRQLDFNLKSSKVLARRLLKKELVPAAVLTMSPTELKDGFIAQVKSPNEPEGSKQFQMTEAICPRCKKNNAGVVDIIQEAGLTARYQLECPNCGHKWYASRDDVSSLAADTPSVAGNASTDIE